MRAVIVFILVSLVASLALGQPEIRQMSLEESSSELTIRGSFGMTEGRVTIDAETVQISSWTDSVVIVIIPKFGKGSSGPVQVHAFNSVSAAQMLTAWDLHVGGGSYHQMSCGAYNSWEYGWNLKFRLALESLLLNGENLGRTIKGNRGSMSGTFEHEAPIYEECAPGDKSYTISDRDDSIDFEISLHESPEGLTLTFSAPRPNIPESYVGGGGQGKNIQFDSLYRIKNDGFSNGTGGASSGMYWDGNVSFPVRPLIIKARDPIPVYSPIDSVSVNGAPVHFAWGSAEWVTHYELELARDERFLQDPMRLHSKEASIEMNLSKSSGVYFWRVRGSNDTIIGPWSKVRSFSIQQASVEKETDAIIHTTVNVYDLLGRLVLQFHGSYTDLLRQGLPSGSYLVNGANSKGQLCFIP